MANRITRVYTRTGDKGSTGLADGSRLAKNHPRIECYGTVDELNSTLGICRQFLDEVPAQKDRDTLDKWFYALQNALFNLGSDLATPIESRWQNMITVTDKDVTVLEKLMDQCQTELAPLKEFVLPGGTKLNAFLHQARTICRRAERLTLTLGDEVSINDQALPFLNRLSDFLFVLSRWVQLKSNVAEVTWSQAAGDLQGLCS